MPRHARMQHLRKLAAEMENFEIVIEIVRLKLLVRKHPRYAHWVETRQRLKARPVTGPLAKP